VYQLPQLQLLPLREAQQQRPQQQQQQQQVGYQQRLQPQLLPLREHLPGLHQQQQQQLLLLFLVVYRQARLLHLLSQQQLPQAHLVWVRRVPAPQQQQLLLVHRLPPRYPQEH
jgi:hypothetical protein